MDRWGASQDSADARENGGVWISEDQKVPDARVFYANNGNGLSMLSHYVYSMTNVRLRELTLGYDLPSRWFNDKIGIDGVILTKLDGTAKGGIAVAIQSELDIPVKYIGVGESIHDLQKFDADQFVNALFHTSEENA